MDLITQEIEQHAKRHLESMKDHVLERISSETYLMRKPGTMMFCVYLSFLPFGTVIAGDFCPGRHGVISSNWRYGLEWFSGRLGAGYLAEKFLSDVFTKERAVLKAKNWLLHTPEDEQADWGEGWSQFYQSIIRQQDDIYGPDTIIRLADDAGVILDDGCPGYGYDIGDQADLVAIQRKFSELYRKHREMTDGYFRTASLYRKAVKANG
jgi:hypothetical protein